MKMNKEKTLEILRRTIESLEGDIKICKENKDLHGEYYYRGRTEGLEQLVFTIESGRLD